MQIQIQRILDMKKSLLMVSSNKLVNLHLERIRIQASSHIISLVAELRYL